MSSLFQEQVPGISRSATLRSFAASVGGPIGDIGVDRDIQGHLQTGVESPIPIISNPLNVVSYEPKGH